MAQFNDDALWSAVKRKNVQDVLAFVFTECGYDAAAEVAKSTTRMTDQAITRMREALDAPLETDTKEVEDSDKAVDQTELDTDEKAEEMVENKLITLEKDIVDAIKKGKRKKAKKAWDALAATGARGSVMKDLKRQIKKLEK